jgi:hypothetical protein
MFSKTLKKQIPEIIELYDNSNLDILLLSYLWPFEMVENNYFPLLQKSENLKIQGYPDDLWGAHMYFMSRIHADTLVKRYTSEYAISQTPEKPFCTDWQFTKFGNRALLNPMVGLEEGDVKTDHEGQIDFHRRCFLYNYKPEKFV